LAIADTSTLSPTLYVSPSVGLSIVNSWGETLKAEV
jgi:hypothetical protein